MEVRVWTCLSIVDNDLLVVVVDARSSLSLAITETEVWKEALNTLGSESASNMSSTEFRIVGQNHVDRFP